MKKSLFLLLPLVFMFTLSGAELFYSNGTSTALEKSADFSAVRRSASDAFVPKNELYRMNTGKTVLSIVMGKGELPVYFLGNQPVVAETTIFWRGEKSVEYMEKKYGLKLTEILPTYPLYAFSVQGDSVEVAEKIVKNGDGYAFPDLVREAVLRFVPEKTPKDPYFDIQWHLQNRGGKILNYYNEEVEILKNADTKFIQMLDFLNTNQIEVDTNTKIAIMDTGIAPDHEDLTNIEPGYDAIERKEGGYPDLSDLKPYEDTPYIQIAVLSVGHGTQCAGVSAGEGNDIGMSGMCPWCRLYPVRYLKGLEATAMSADSMLRVYEKYVADPEISVINCSFGPQYNEAIGPISITPTEIESHMNFLKNGRNGKGGAIVYASGNDGADSAFEELLGYDFKFERNGVQVTDKVVTVNASSAWDTRVEYSNYGYYSTVTAPSLSETPSVGIAAASIPGYGDYKSNYTLAFSGTSAAAPVVSGLLGAVFSINPELTLEEAIEILKQSSDKINPETGLWDKDGFSVKFGYGRINLEKAARLAAKFPMCEKEQEEVCGNHIDDDCDGYVDEGCAAPLTAGQPCEKAEDCLSGSLTLDDVECLHEKYYWTFENGYCSVKMGKIPCPDGTKTFNVAKESRDNYLCALECNSVKPCEREGYYCSNEVLGICLPNCSDNSGCNEGSVCNDEGKCEKVPSDIGGSCSKDEECDGEDTTCNTWNRGGYCTQTCYDNDDSYCPKGSKCVTGNRWEGTHCLASCSSDKDCRVEEGYVCHPQMGSKNGVCYRTCRNAGDCSDEDAICTGGGYCATEDWQGWPEEEEDDDDQEEDSDQISDDDSTENEGNDKPKEILIKTDGCSIVVM